MSMPILTIMISSTARDLPQHRQSVMDACIRQNTYPIMMEHLPAADADAIAESLAMVDRADIYLGILAYRYGYIPTGHKISIMEMEYNRAVERGIPRLIFLMHEDHPVKPADVERGPSANKVDALRQRVGQERVVAFFRSADELHAKVIQSLVAALSLVPPVTTPDEPASRELRLRSLLLDHSGFMHDRLNSFVGRATELEELRQHIAAQMATGGYVTIAGQAGQGKSSVIAKLVQAAGPAQVAHHFIPFNPGPDHQVSLLRNLMARLILKYNLSDLYIVSESRPALRDYFAKVLSEIAGQSGQEVIYIDGLDQLEEDLNGVRDLSFLPTNPPLGIVFVLGTRPNDTLKPLELLKPRNEYPLPNLSRTDFDLILEHRGVRLEAALVTRFYEAMHENALYLDLVAKELADAEAIDPESIIRRIADNPDNLFSLSTDRLKRQAQSWREVLKPILGVLLVAQEPLSTRSLRSLIRLDDDALQDGLQVLGGLIACDGHGRYSLYHLKLRDYLRQDEAKPFKRYIFATDEEQGWHQRLAEWCVDCPGGLPTIWQDVATNAPEQERRLYARQHYITHLYLALDWDTLWNVLDHGQFGQAKLHFDPSTRSYAQDLDLARRAASHEKWGLDEGIVKLDYLWRYTLLRCSLASQADNYPDSLFQGLVLVGREKEVIGLVEMLTDPKRKARILGWIGQHLLQKPARRADGQQLMFRATEVARSIEDTSERAFALFLVCDSLVAVGQPEQALQLLQEVIPATHLIENAAQRVQVLRTLARVLTAAQQPDRAIQFLQDATLAACSIGDVSQRVQALRAVAGGLVAVEQLEQALQLLQEAIHAAHSIEAGFQRAEALRIIVVGLIAAQQWHQAEAIAYSIEWPFQRVQALRSLASYLIVIGLQEQALHLLQDATLTAHSIKETSSREYVLRILAGGLVAAQQWQEATVIADSIDTAVDRAQVLSTIVEGLATAQQWQHAIELANSIENARYRARALSTIAEGLVAIGEQDQALRLLQDARLAVRLIKETPQRVQALRTMVSSLVAAQQWQPATVITKSIEDAKQRSDVLRMIIGGLTKAQEWQQAIELANSIEITNQQVEALGMIVRGLIATQQWEQAEAIAHTINNDVERAKALIMIAEGLVIAGEQDQALRLLEDATFTARAIKEASLRVQALRSIAASLAATQQWQHIEALLESVSKDRHRGEVLSTIIEGLVVAQRWQQAAALAYSIEKPRYRARALSSIAEGLAATEEQDQASQLLEDARIAAYSIKEPSQRLEALHYVAGGLIAAQQWQAATTIANSIEDAKQRSDVLRMIISGLARAQQWQRAEAIAYSIEDDKQLAEMLGIVAVRLAKTEQWKQAEALTYRIKDGLHRTKTLSTIAEGLVIAGEQDQALRLLEDATLTARAIKEASLRVQALRSIAASLVAAQQPDRALELLQEAILAARSIEVASQRVRMLHQLTELLALHPSSLLSLIQTELLNATTRDHTLHLVLLFAPLIRLRPELSMTLAEGIHWVDQLLRA